MRPRPAETISDDHTAQGFVASQVGATSDRRIAVDTRAVWLAQVKAKTSDANALRIAELLALRDRFPLVTAWQQELQREAAISHEKTQLALITLQMTGLLQRPAKGVCLCSAERAAPRRTPKLKGWKRAVFKLDGHRCVDCGAQRELEAHHIYPQAAYPERALDRRNGVTLCRDCHARLRCVELEHAARFEQIVEARHG